MDHHCSTRAPKWSSLSMITRTGYQAPATCKTDPLDHKMARARGTGTAHVSMSSCNEGGWAGSSMNVAREVPELLPICKRIPCSASGSKPILGASYFWFAAIPVTVGRAPTTAPPQLLKPRINRKQPGKPTRSCSTAVSHGPVSSGIVVCEGGIVRTCRQSAGRA